MTKAEMILDAVESVLHFNGIDPDKIESVESNCGSAWIKSRGKTYSLSLVKCEPSSECPNCGSEEPPAEIREGGKLTQFQCKECNHRGTPSDFAPLPF